MSFHVTSGTQESFVQQQEVIGMLFCVTSGTQESFILVQDLFTDCMLHACRHQQVAPQSWCILNLRVCQCLQQYCTTIYISCKELRILFILPSSTCGASVCISVLL